MDEKNEQSETGKLNATDIKRWLHNAGIFLGPVAIIYLAPIPEALQDGMNLADFIPSPMVQGAITLYFVNTAMDLIRKFLAGPKE